MNYYRRCRTAQEVKANEEIREDGERVKFGRACRGRRYLDRGLLARHAGQQKSWKKKRKNKYYEAGTKLRKHTFYLPEMSWRQRLNIEEYFKKNGIPYKITEKGRRENRTWTQYKKNEFCGYKDIRDTDGKLYYRKPIWKEIILDKPVKHTYHCHISEGYNITYWSNKSIGLNFILNKENL